MLVLDKEPISKPIIKNRIKILVQNVVWLSVRVIFNQMLSKTLDLTIDRKKLSIEIIITFTTACPGDCGILFG